MALFPKTVLKGILKKIRQFGVIYIYNIESECTIYVRENGPKGKIYSSECWMSRLQSPVVRSRRLLQVEVPSRTWHKVFIKGRKRWHCSVHIPPLETAVAYHFSCEVTALQCSRCMKHDRVNLGRVCTQPVCWAPHAGSWKEIFSSLSLQSLAASLDDALINTP